jgi:hypothetical protein
MKTPKIGLSQQIHSISSPKTVDSESNSWKLWPPSTKNIIIQILGMSNTSSKSVHYWTLLHFASTTTQPESTIPTHKLIALQKA